MIEVDFHPTVCNICGGKVIYASNEKVYGIKHGSGMFYYCTKCGAYVGTHSRHPREALGTLADKKTRFARHACHEKFDEIWMKRKRKNRKKSREKMYDILSKRMGIGFMDCHFGYMDLPLLRKAYKEILQMRQEFL